MSGIDNKHLLVVVSIEKILMNTEFEKYITTLKRNGIINIKDINTMRNNSSLGVILNDCIENEEDVLSLMELFDKKIQSIYQIYNFIFLGTIGIFSYYAYQIYN